MLSSKEEMEIILFNVSWKKLKLILLIYKTINIKILKIANILNDIF